MSPTRGIPTNVDTSVRAAKRKKEGKAAAEVRARTAEAGKTRQTTLSETQDAQRRLEAPHEAPRTYNNKRFRGSGVPQTLDENPPLSQTRGARPLNDEDDIVETGKPMDIAFVLLKNNTPSTTYCSEKGCHAHAKRVAPEDGKAYCDVCVSNKMKEPKPEKPEDKAKKVGVSGGG